MVRTAAPQQLYLGGGTLVLFFPSFLSLGQAQCHLCGHSCQFCSPDCCNVGFCAAKITNYKVVSYLWLFLSFLVLCYFKLKYVANHLCVMKYNYVAAISYDTAV